MTSNAHEKLLDLKISQQREASAQARRQQLLRQSQPPNRRVLLPLIGGMGVIFLLGVIGLVSPGPAPASAVPTLAIFAMFSFGLAMRAQNLALKALRALIEEEAPALHRELTGTKPVDR